MVTHSSLQASSWNESEIAQFADLLRQCSRSKNLAQGKHLHSQLRRKEYDQGTFLGNLTLQMYGSCGQLDEAKQVFQGILDKNLYSWSIMIAVFVDNNRCVEALKVFQFMQLDGVKPDEVTFISLLKACSHLKSLSEGEKIHAAVPEPSIKLENCLISLYVRCDTTHKARRVFDSMKQRDVVSWNTMIGAYAEKGNIQEALELCSEMEGEGIHPDRITFSNIFRGFGRAGEEEGDGVEGQILEVHEKLAAIGMDLNAVGISLIAMYGKRGRVDDARRVFEGVRRRGNTAVWNCMMATYARNGYTKKALDVYWKMDSQAVKMNEATFVTALAACAGGGFVTTGKRIHQHSEMSGFGDDDDVGAGLINMYSKCGSLADAKAVFYRLPKKIDGSLYVWNSMISACLLHGEGEEAVRLFRLMDLEGLKADRATLASVLGACSSCLSELRALHDRICFSGYGDKVDVCNSLINSYGKCGAVLEAEKVFASVKKCRSVVSWTSMITVYGRNDRASEAIKVFKRMKKEGVTPNAVTYVSVLGACGSIQELKQGKAIHDEVRESKADVTNVIVANAVLNMYGCCGCLSEAKDVFEKMEYKNSVSWSVMTSSCCRAGDVKDAVLMLRRMYLLGFVPSVGTLKEVLQTCNEKKLVAEANICLEMMRKTYGECLINV